MHQAIQILIDTFEAYLSELPANEIKAHEANGAYRFIAYNNETFVEQLKVAYGLLNRGRKRVLKFIDVGCGIGSKVVLASNAHHNIDAYGIEINSKYVEVAKKLVDAPRSRYRSYDSNTDRTKASSRIFKGDAREHDYAPYDIIYFFCPMLDETKQQVLEQQIYKTAKPGALIIANLKKTREDKKNHIRAVWSGDSADIYKKMKG